MKLLVSVDLAICVPLNVWRGSAEFLSEIRNTGSWWTLRSLKRGLGPLVGILDEELAQVAWNLERGKLIPLGAPGSEKVSIPVARIGDISDRGPYHADIYWDNARWNTAWSIRVAKACDSEPNSITSNALGA